MKRKATLALIIGLVMLYTGFSTAQTGDSNISVNVDRTCHSAVNNFDFTSSNLTDDNGNPIIGTGGLGYFTYLPANLGEMSYVKENISIYRLSENTLQITENMSVENQSSPYNEIYLFNSTHFDADSEKSRLLKPNGTVMRAPYWYERPFDNWGKSRPSQLTKIKLFVASPQFTSGLYQAKIRLNYSCEFEPSAGSEIKDESTDTSYNYQNFPISQYTDSEIRNHILLEGLNVSVIDTATDYTRTVFKTTTKKVNFRVFTVQGNGSTPDEIADVENEIGRNLETDADEVSNFTKNASLEKDLNESVNSTRQVNLDANQTSDLKKNSSLETDVNETTNSQTNVDTDVDEQVTNSTPIEGNSTEPGQTEVPRPEPTPLLSVEMRPLNTTYTTPKKQFKEVKLEVTNTGLGNFSELQIEPRFSDEMNWSAQRGQLGSLQKGQSKNISVFVRPGEEVEPAIYQIPVYASEGDKDIGNQFVNVEVTEEISTSVLQIGEAPQNIRFEAGQNYTLPVLIENSGSETLEDVEIELQNIESCGDYDSEEIDEIARGESRAISLNVTTTKATGECSATVVASSSSGSYAFSELTVEMVESKGVVPKEFRVPLIASLWTLMLIIYTIVMQRRGLESATVKIPLIILVIGEAVILIYLASSYYSFIPSEILPFN